MILNFNTLNTKLINQPLHSIIRPWATYSLWQFDPIFKGYYNKCKMRTFVDEYRCFELWQIAVQQQKVEGNFLEVGV